MAKNEAGGSALVVAGGQNLPAAFLDAAMASTGSGLSQAAGDNVVPRIVLLQSNSPEIDPSSSSYIEGAQAGMLLNRANKQLYACDEERAAKTGKPILEFVHSAFDRAVLQWVPREQGGGLVGRHPVAGDDVEATMRKIGAKQVPDAKDPNKMVWKTADGRHDLVDTRDFYGHVVKPDGSLAPAVISFSSTGHTPARQWMTLMNEQKITNPSTGETKILDAWFKKYRVLAKPRKNAKGTFYQIQVEDLGASGFMTRPADWAAGKALHDAFHRGEVSAERDESSDNSVDEKIPI